MTNLAAEEKRSKLQKAEYKAQIKTIHDLVKFLYENNVNSEYRDYEAAAAAKECAVELGVPVE